MRSDGWRDPNEPGIDESHDRVPFTVGVVLYGATHTSTTCEFAHRDKLSRYLPLAGKRAGVAQCAGGDFQGRLRESAEICPA
jgi:hypothetical protein